MGALVLAFQLASHVFYVPAIALSVAIGRLQIAVAVTCVVIASLHYHVCLDGGVCLTTLRLAGAYDYVFGMLAGAVLLLQLEALRHDLMSFFLYTDVFFAVAMIPSLYNNWRPFVFFTGYLTLQTFAPDVVMRRRTQYPNPGVRAAAYVLSAVSYVLIAFPADIQSYWYNILHPIWHMFSGLSIFVYVLILAHKVIVWVNFRPMWNPTIYYRIEPPEKHKSESWLQL